MIKIIYYFILHMIIRPYSKITLMTNAIKNCCGTTVLDLAKQVKILYYYLFIALIDELFSNVIKEDLNFFE